MLRLPRRWAPLRAGFGGVEGQDDPSGTAIRRLSEIAERLRPRRTDLLETHDLFLTGAAVADVLSAVDSPRVGALWDLVNPWRAGEISSADS